MLLSAERIAAQCEGKQSFDSYPEAERVMKRRQRRKKGPIYVHPYRCVCCAKYHLGNKVK